jgi:hypothetical protein
MAVEEQDTDTGRDNTNRELFRLVMSQAFDLTRDGTWIDSLFDSAKRFYDQNITGDAVVELLLREENAPEPFKNRFRLYLEKDRADTTAGRAPRFGNIATFLATERAIGDKLSSYGNAFQALNTQESINNLISGDVSADEVGRRIDNAYYAIQTADETLKNEIKKILPSATDADLARALVTGNTDALTGAQKIGQAGIMAAATTTGYGAVASNVSDLQRQGVTREKAATGFQQVARERSGIQQAARTFGATAPTQAELEQEALLGTESRSAKALRSQARAQFGGQSGIATGSLGRKKQA